MIKLAVKQIFTPFGSQVYEWKRCGEYENGKWLWEELKALSSLKRPTLFIHLQRKALVFLHSYFQTDFEIVTSVDSFAWCMATEC